MSFVQFVGRILPLVGLRLSQLPVMVMVMVMNEQIRARVWYQCHAVSEAREVTGAVAAWRVIEMAVWVTREAWDRSTESRCV